MIFFTLYCQKNCFLFVRDSETGRKGSLWQGFLACFAASAKKFYSDSVCILCLSCNVQKFQNLLYLSCNHLFTLTVSIKGHISTLSLQELDINSSNKGTHINLIFTRT
jgi:hypothetical protein